MYKSYIRSDLSAYHDECAHADSVAICVMIL